MQRDVLIFSLVWWHWIPQCWSPERLLNKNKLMCFAFYCLWCPRLFAVVTCELCMCESVKSTSISTLLWLLLYKGIQPLYKGCFQKQPSLILFQLKPKGFWLAKSKACAMVSQFSPAEILGLLQSVKCTSLLTSAFCSECQANTSSNFAALSLSVLHLTDFFPLL